MRLTGGASLTCLATALLAFYLPLPQGQSAQTSVADRVVSFHITNGRFARARVKLSDLNVSTGFERSDGDEDEPVINVSKDNVRLQDVLDEIVRQYPLYTWKVTNGVVDFIPAQSRSPALREILDAHIERFSPGNNLNQRELAEAIVALPEVQTLLKAHKLTPWRIEGLGIFPSGFAGKDRDLSVFDTDVRSILNGIVSGTNKSWSASIMRNHDGDELFLGFW